MHGRLVLVPDELRVRHHDGVSVVLEPLPGEHEETPDWLVGTVPLVEWDPKSGELGIVELEVPPPPPFAANDAQTMWQEVVAKPVRPLSSIQLQGRTKGGASIAQPGLHAEAVPAALGTLVGLERRWPELETTELIWRPPDVRGGQEDVRSTDRLGAARGGMRTANGTRIPDLTARRRGASLPWGSRRLASACLVLEQALAERSEKLAGSPPLARHSVLSVARRSYAAAPGVDSPPSSWPARGRGAYKAVLRALVALAAEGGGSESVPLCELWRLYESWTVVVALDALTAQYGAPKELGEIDWAWEWQIGEARMRMHSQRAIGATVNREITGHPDGVVSVSSPLIPDLLLSLWREGGKQALICADAKQRWSGSEMQAGDIAEAASKYLWGLRLANDPTTTATTKAIIISSAPVAKMFDEPQSHIGGVHLLPGRGLADFAAELTATVDGTIGRL